MLVWRRFRLYRETQACSPTNSIIFWNVVDKTVASVSELYIAAIFWVEELAEQANSNEQNSVTLHGGTSQKIILFIITAVRKSDSAEFIHTAGGRISVAR
jgi:hypothetical protein